MQLRPYQIKVKNDVYSAVKAGHKRILLQVPTGGGKTIIFTSIIRDIVEKSNKKALVLVHRKELIDQTINKALKYGLTFSVIQADYLYKPFEKYQIASVPTLTRRLDSINFKPDVIITDECFPKGTIVDGKPIENFKIGDSIHAYDEISGNIVLSKVTKTFKNVCPDKLYQITSENNIIVCTGNHPIFTNHGWVKAQNLTNKHYIGILKNEYNSINMQNLQIPYTETNKESKRFIPTHRERILFERMFNAICQNNKLSNYGKNKQNICFAKDVAEQSYEKSSYQKKNVRYFKKNRAYAKNTGWERETNLNTAETIGRSIGLGNGICGKNRLFRERRDRISKSLQNRYSKSIPKNSNRSRWQFSLYTNASKPRQEKRELFSFVRLENIEILEQRSYERFRQMCPDGYVYNLEVEKYHTYIANGIIVHNCHHATANSYRKIYEAYPNAHHIGVSATPTRTNGEGFKDIFDTLVQGPSVRQLIQNGYLVQPKLFARPLNFDLSKVKVTAGDYNEKALMEAMEQSFTYGDLVKTWHEKAEGKKTVVFAININHSKHIVDIYRQAGIKAEHLDAETDSRDRKTIIDKFRAGEITVLSNVNIVTEGFDLPDIECIQLVRPTKSLTLYLQMVGRGLRPADGKEQAIVLDHSNSVFTFGFPEQDRLWTLDGIKKRDVKVVFYDKNTDDYIEHQEHEHIEGMELVELDFDEVRWEFLKKQIDFSKKRGFKIGFAWHRFIDKFKVPTKYELIKFGKLAGYKPGWATYKFKEFNLG